MKTGLTEPDLDERVKEVIAAMIKYVAARATTNAAVLAQHGGREMVHTDDIVTALQYETVFGTAGVAQAVIERYSKGEEDNLTAEERYFAQNAMTVYSSFQAGYSLPIITPESLVLPFPSYMGCTCSFCFRVRNELPQAWEGWTNADHEEESVATKLIELIARYRESV